MCVGRWADGQRGQILQPYDYQGRTGDEENECRAVSALGSGGDDTGPLSREGPGDREHGDDRPLPTEMDCRWGSLSRNPDNPEPDQGSIRDVSCDRAHRGVKKPSSKTPLASISCKWCCICPLQAVALEPMAHAAVVALAVPSVLERYGVGWDDEPPSRS
jgi:hypothetical protein